MTERDLSHLDEEGNLRMVDVGGKPVSSREAVARARIRLGLATLDLLMERALPKGDALAAARVAGILAAKKTSELIPLTHPLHLSFIDVGFDADRSSGSLIVTSTVRCEAKTGAEMEALTACAIAALTIYDMCKSAEKGIVIEEVRLVRKSGGKSGEWVAPG